jgi:two-component system, sensor histidine kinase PdtaS
MTLPTVPAMASFRMPSGLQEGSTVCPTSSHNEVADSLALALVASSQAPILLLDGDLAIIAASASFCRAFQIDPATAAGLEVFALGSGEWNVPQLRSLLDVTLSGITGIDSYEMDLKRDHRESRRVVLKAEKLAYGDAEHARILLAISDVTDARVAERLRDELLRQKDSLVQDKVLLLQELQHRVANSLQIIASVLMMSARKVQSEETRGHLHDAHSRVMSIAALQQQLAASSVGDIKLRAYFTKLCQTLGASMIRDHKQIQLEVNIDESAVHADVSVSLGLIVTELVINALKHAFPEDRIGKILVDYRSRGPNWALSVSDNGVGMPPKSKKNKGGLGSSLIEALAKQLEANVGVADAHPGTAVSIAHSQVAAVAVDGSPAMLPRAV